METAKANTRPSVEDLVNGIEKNLTHAKETRSRVNGLLNRINEGRPDPADEGKDRHSNPINHGAGLLNDLSISLNEMNDMISDLENWIGFSNR
jgi:hypothetical protein